jgi:ethanolamine utilization protein EutL
MIKALDIKPEMRAIGIITADCDDVTYIALDEATKKAQVEVVYGRSMYAGAGNASTKLAGEVIGILAGPTPAEVRSGLDATVDFIENGANFVSANDDDSVVYLAHVVSRTGSYLSAGAEVKEGEAIAYLIAAPGEAIVGIDAALKAAEVEFGTFYAPPSETNFAGALLTGTLSACRVACEAFGEAIRQVAARPREV